MINIAICDDDLKSANLISKIFKDEMASVGFDGNIVAVTDNQEVIYELIKEDKIEVLFLDIDFKNSEKNGIVFAEELRKLNKNFYLIYITGHSRFMHVAYLNKTFDYLIKPINKNTISDLFYRLKADIYENSKCLVKFNNNLALNPEKIFYIEKQGHTANIFTNEEQYSINSGSIDSIIKILPKNFKRCHRSYIVNENKIIGFEKKNNILFLDDNISCPFSSVYNIDSNLLG